MGGRLKRSGDVCIHVDHEVLLLGDFGVALFDVVLDPSGEVVTGYGVSDIHDPLLRQLASVLRFREKVLHLRVTA